MTVCDRLCGFDRLSFRFNVFMKGTDPSDSGRGGESRTAIPGMVRDGAAFLAGTLGPGCTLYILRRQRQTYRRINRARHGLRTHNASPAVIKSKVIAQPKTRCQLWVC